LGESYPNPFNSSVTIEYSVGVGDVIAARGGGMRLEIFDISGQRVRRLAVPPISSGSFQAVWDGRNDTGAPVGTGVYLYQLRVDHRTEARRMLLLR
jgi:flagellar hook assembly protein FlgD